MEAEAADDKTIRAWARAEGIPDAASLALINRRRAGYGLPPFRIAKVLGCAEPIPQEKRYPTATPAPIVEVVEIEILPPVILTEDEVHALPAAVDQDPAPIEPAAEVLPPRKDEVLKRTSASLREALFQELDDLRNGRSDPKRALAVANLAKTIVETVKVEIEFARHVGNDQPIGPLPLVG